MGCIPVKKKITKIGGPSTGVDPSPDDKNIKDVKTVKELKINEGLFVTEINEDPFISIYQKMDKINEGAFGAVYKAKHIVSGVIRAIKIIKKQSIGMNEGDEKELMDEVNTLKSLDHPNIMKVYEYFNTKDSFYIVSELCSGGDLFDKIANQPLKEEQSAYVMRQLLSAVNFCHQNKIIHRDLKPENIMIESEKENYKQFFTIKVIDFGTSGKISKDNMMNEQIGTCDYIAPEVLKNQYNEKCDIWSSGVILFYMLTGKLPFHGENEAETLEKVKKGEFNFDDEIWDPISSKCKNFIKNLLNKKIDKRYSAAEALNDPWIQETCSANKIVIERTQLEILVHNLKNFSATNKLHQASLAYIVHNLSKKEDAEPLRPIFIKFDENCDGRLNLDELTKGLMIVLPKEESEKEANRIMNIIDADGNGFIEYEEFLRATMDRNAILTEGNLQAAFGLFDINKRNRVSPQELKSVLGKGAEGITDDDWKTLIVEIDLNKDGEISFDEFKHMMLNND